MCRVCERDNKQTAAHFHSVCVCVCVWADTGGAVQLEAGHHTVRQGGAGAQVLFSWKSAIKQLSLIGAL